VTTLATSAIAPTAPASDNTLIYAVVGTVVAVISAAATTIACKSCRKKITHRGESDSWSCSDEFDEPMHKTPTAEFLFTAEIVQ
jgi:hypothetical protein